MSFLTSTRAAPETVVYCKYIIKYSADSYKHSNLTGISTHPKTVKMIKSDMNLNFFFSDLPVLKLKYCFQFGLYLGYLYCG